MDLALKAKVLPISSLAFVPPLIHPGSPKFSLMHRLVQAKIAASEAADSAAASPSPTPTPTSAATPLVEGASSHRATKKVSAKRAQATKKARQPRGQETDNLSAVCSAR